MNDQLALAADRRESVQIRVRGRVQGVGFRPTVWRHARDCALDGEVLNDGEGVLIRVRGSSDGVERFIARLRAAPPPLADIAAIEVTTYGGSLDRGFRIAESAQSAACTDISPDAAICAACTEEVLDPFARRYRYPFTNCTHCGPRLTIVRSVPYDRVATTMAPFPLCEDCAREYGDPADRRFHAEPIACHLCGPRARLIRFDGRAISAEQHSMLDDVDAAMSLIQKGEIVAVKALGGYQLACDATKAETVARLRELKRRDAKPFALMARDTDVIRRYCSVSPQEEEALRSPAAPIVLLEAAGPERLPEGVAPGLRTLGFMLPPTPLHVLMFRRMKRPAVMTSGNRSDEPQVIDDREAGETLSAIAPYALIHNRAIANRVDDSVARWIGGQLRLLRRARGHAPASIPLPQGFEEAPEILAYGPQMKATFCLLKDGRAVLSQHQGDLDDAATWCDYLKNLELFRTLFGHAPQALACDMHPEYLSTKLAVERSKAEGLPLVQAQHHHAHLAACLAENGRPLDAPAVLGIALDGLGYGIDGTIWGGEFLLFDYRSFERLGTFKPVAMPGGARASREPWRNLYAHLMAEMGWAQFAMSFDGLGLFQKLSCKPRATLDAMIRSDTNCPLASSCGRLFDAVAASLDICFEHQAYEGEAAARLEAIACRKTLAEEGDRLAYPLTIPNLRGSGLPYIEPLGMWNAILGDLILDTDVSVIAARFHKGLAKAIVAMALKLADRGEEGAAVPRFDTVALSGGCFQNRILLEETIRRLEASDFKVLTHAAVPANDGGVALGQAAIAAARLIDNKILRRQGA
ncbi:Carbamoyltransferase HypF [Methylobacterium isbiliense]|uniref:Carbamoyltransferase HypF n=1 Tax=Methylobacterium isbiliense TaxID=315478 RepID=A0ABQ4SKE3_9HYPH|nr:Carbamoyltransferase HypF [Methylobacterium isbiliense]